MMHIRIVLLVLLSCQAQSTALAQPVIPSKQEVSGLSVFRDLKNLNLYYYAPGKLEIATEKDGKPRFTLLAMRYTGSGKTGDQNSQRFMNLVQVGVWMKQANGTQLNAAKALLGGSKIILQPLPLKNAEAYLVMPMGNSDGAYKRIGKAGGFEGKSPENGYWSERYFTVRLENHEAQLLWDQFESGKLAISIGYAFYAEAITDQAGEAHFSDTDSTQTSEIREAISDVVKLDSTPVVSAIASGAFALNLDPGKWPDLFKKIDINDEAPPAYAMLELKCYDFTNGLRPDLSMKSVEIVARGVSGEDVVVKGKRFVSGHPDQNSLQVNFPYAVKIDQPYKYRISEYSRDGELLPGAKWVYQSDWSSLLDVTTPEAANKMKAYDVDIETDPSALDSAGIEELWVGLLYSQNGKATKLSLNWKQGDMNPIKNVHFFADKAVPVKYFTRRKKAGNWILSPDRRLGTDNYIYVDVRK